METERAPHRMGAAEWVVHRIRVVTGAPLRRTAAISGVLVVVLLCLLDLAYRSRFGDLHSFCQGVIAWWHGQDPYGQLPATYAGGTPGFIYPPFALLPLSVFAALPFPAAAVLSVLISCACLGVTCFAVLRGVWPRGGVRGCLHVTVLVMPLLLVLEPVRNTVGHGQVNLWLMALVAADCLVERPKWPRGTLIGIAAAIKITPAAFVLFLVARKDFRAAVVAAVTAALSTGATFALMPVESDRFWCGGVLAGPVGIVNRDNQSIAAGLHRLGLAGSWHTAAWLALAGLVLMISVVIMRRVGTEAAMVTNGFAALLISPLSWTAHWVWVAPALVVYAATVLPASAGRPTRVRDRSCYVLIAVTVFLMVGPQVVTPAEGPWAGWQYLLVNAYPLAALGLLVVGAVQLRVRRWVMVGTVLGTVAPVDHRHGDPTVAHTVLCGRSSPFCVRIRSHGVTAVARRTLACTSWQTLVLGAARPVRAPRCTTRCVSCSPRGATSRRCGKCPSGPVCTR
ncbi:glycosyltransferase family 87 protein [Kibdelosporangium phytohabitans]|uniref:glycosyltransferase family 87 protein n=1 Tax=Kibdelosporangium phytohabitans TaxID=860235 RepID=UPI0009FA98EF|nr:glycosyltransferase family 87 protein [Kibdelosporangium phytohabitans]MBE1468720.1 alpha-1,2-mannosyltransferase [Kibdelosporangium phytohabitans]